MVPAPRPVSLLMRKRAPTASVVLAPTGTANVRVVLPLKPLAMMALAVSPVSRKSPSRFQSTKPYSVAAAPLVLVALTVKVLFWPAMMLAGMVTPSSSSAPPVSSPVAVALGWARGSASMAAPRRRFWLAKTWYAPSTPLYSGEGRSPKSRDWPL